MGNSHLKLISPSNEIRTDAAEEQRAKRPNVRPVQQVTPRRRPNAETRTREYLTEAEVEKLIEVNRWGHRDATMIRTAYRHGLRVSELTDLRWEQVEFEQACLHVRRAKNGTPSVHPIQGDELRALRRLQREQSPASPFVFTTERGTPFSVSGFQRLIARAGDATGAVTNQTPIGGLNVFC